MGFGGTGDPYRMGTGGGYQGNAKSAYTGAPGSNDDWANAVYGAGKSAWDWAKGAMDPMNGFQAGVQAPPPGMESALSSWALTGTGPSAAQSLLNQQAQHSVAQAASSAKSAPGLDLAARNRLASEGQATALSEAGANAAQLRAQEQQAAMQGWQGLYKTQAEAYADAMRANAQVAAQNASTRGNILTGVVNGIGKWVGL